MADAVDTTGWDEPDLGQGRRPDHVPQLHRAMSEATADLDAVEDRLSTLFDRDGGSSRHEAVTAREPRTTVPGGTAEHGAVAGGGFDDGDDELLDLFADEDDEDAVEEAAADDLGLAEPVVADRRAIIGEYEDDIGGEFAELDAELAAENPDQPTGKGTRRMFRRRAKGTAVARRG
jgi:hypothetical protein